MFNALPATRKAKMFKKEISALLIAILGAALPALVSCSTTGMEKDPDTTSTPVAVPVIRLSEPTRTIYAGDMLRMDVSVPGRKYGALEQVQKSGDVATPDGSFIRADGVSLGQFRTDLLKIYQNIPGYEKVEATAFIDSSPYKVVRYNPNRHSAGATEPEKKKKSWDKDFWADFNNRSKPEPKPEAAAPANAEPPAATLYPRNFSSPITLWEAIEKEGGMPVGVERNQIHVLRRDLERLTFDCSGPFGRPDGARPVESGDVIFLVPEGTPLHGIFE